MLKAKHSSATRSSSQSSQQVWNRVALAAESSSILPSTQAPRPFLQPVDRFPVLSGSGSGANSSSSSLPASGFRQGQRNTPWSGSSAPPSSLGTRPTPTSVNVLGSSKSTKQAPKLSSTLFPELPSSTTARAKPQVSGNVSLKNILGSKTVPVVSAWQPKSGDGSGLANTAVVEEQGEAGEGPVSGDATAAATATAQTKGKKGKAKQKQTLFTMGSFPT